VKLILILRIQRNKLRAQSTEHRAQSTEHRAQSTEHNARSIKHKSLYSAGSEQSAKCLSSGDLQISSFLNNLPLGPAFREMGGANISWQHLQNQHFHQLGSISNFNTHLLLLRRFPANFNTVYCICTFFFCQRKYPCHIPKSKLWKKTHPT
jgi:hypothetical protein